MGTVTQNTSLQVSSKILAKIKSFLEFEDLTTCILVPKSESTHGCLDAYLSKREFLLQLKLCTEYSAEMKTIVFRAWSNREKCSIAFHIPATLQLPAHENGKFDFQTIIKIVNFYSETKFKKLSFYPNLKHGCLNPIDLSIDHKNIIHFFHKSYKEEPPINYFTTNAGVKGVGVVLDIRQIFKAFTKKRINYFIFNTEEQHGNNN